jgi:DNA-binding CsgD family transcriptional regulator
MVSKPTANFEEAISLTPATLAENEQGRISSDQRRTLRRQRLIWIAGSIGFVFVLTALLAALFLKLSTPAFASRGQLLPWFPIGLFWLWLLGPSLPKWLRTNHELRQGQVAVVDGYVQCEISHTFGILQLLKYRIRIGGNSFQVRNDVFFQFKNRAAYRVFYSPHSGTFLSALPLTAAPSISFSPETSIAHDERRSTSGIPARTLQPVASPVPEPAPEDSPAAALNRHEREILRLIAAGHSNKEIAAELSLSLNTIKMYTSQLYRKLGVHRRTEAVALARRIGLL